ncbi:hypothetical protein XENOCAPTIV_011631, partial [Xenoophorus captivus]
DLSKKEKGKRQTYRDMRRLGWKGCKKKNNSIRLSQIQQDNKHPPVSLSLSLFLCICSCKLSMHFSLFMHSTNNVFNGESWGFASSLNSEKQHEPSEGEGELFASAHGEI